MDRPTTLTVHVKPGSAKPGVRVLGQADGHVEVEVRVRAKPVDGAANSAVVRAIADALDVRKSAVTIVRGSRSRIKHVRVERDPEAVRAALRDQDAAR